MTEIGTWTMIYDEGFEIRALGKRYMAFSKYKATTNLKPKNTDDEKTEGYKSYCNETLLGWVRDENN
jgi:cathepsin C